MKPTFQELDEESGLPTLGAAAGRSPLENWYRMVKDTPLDQFSIEDLCRSCRQGLYLSEVVPVALARLQTDPSAGELYGGELVSAVVGLPSDFWARNPESALATLQLVKNLPSTLGAELDRKVERFLKVTENVVLGRGETQL